MHVLEQLSATALLLTSALAAQTAVVWRRLTPSTLPPPRFQGAMVYDEFRDRLVLFGGLRRVNTNYVLLNDTWEYDGVRWIRMNPVVSPPAMANPRAYYDRNLQRVIVCNGTLRSGGLGQIWSSWEWDGSNWKRVLQYSPKTNPPTGPYSQGDMAYYPPMKSAFYFSGNNMTNVRTMLTADTWVFVPRNRVIMPYWTKVLVGGVAPLGRAYAGMLYCPNSGTIIMHGGLTWTRASNYWSLADTWQLSPQGWRQLQTTGPTRSAITMVPWFDSGDVAFFGGGLVNKNTGGFTSIYNDLWVFRGRTGTWSKITPSSTTMPVARADYQAAYDSKRRRILIFGGFQDWYKAVYGDFWELRPVRTGPMLSTSVSGISISKGGNVAFSLNGGASLAGRLYLLMGTMSGTQNRWNLGSVTVPLALDFYTLYTVLYPNSPVLVNSMGRLNGNGAAQATLRVFPNLFSSSLIGRRVHHAYIVFGPLSIGLAAASNPVPLLLGP